MDPDDNKGSEVPQSNGSPDKANEAGSPERPEKAEKKAKSPEKGKGRGKKEKSRGKGSGGQGSAPPSAEGSRPNSPEIKPAPSPPSPARYQYSRTQLLEFGKVAGCKVKPHGLLELVDKGNVTSPLLKPVKKGPSAPGLGEAPPGLAPPGLGEKQPPPEEKKRKEKEEKKEKRKGEGKGAKEEPKEVVKAAKPMHLSAAIEEARGKGKKEQARELEPWMPEEAAWDMPAAGGRAKKDDLWDMPATGGEAGGLDQFHLGDLEKPAREEPGFSFCSEDSPEHGPSRGMARWFKQEEARLPRSPGSPGKGSNAEGLHLLAMIQGEKGGKEKVKAMIQASEKGKGKAQVSAAHMQALAQAQAQALAQAQVQASHVAQVQMFAELARAGAPWDPRRTPQINQQAFAAFMAAQMKPTPQPRGPSGEEVSTCAQS